MDIEEEDTDSAAADAASSMDTRTVPEAAVASCCLTPPSRPCDAGKCNFLDLGPRVVIGADIIGKEPVCYVPGHQFCHYHVYEVRVPLGLRAAFCSRVHTDFALVENIGGDAVLVQYRHFESWKTDRIVVRGPSPGTITVHDKFIDETTTCVWHLRDIAAEYPHYSVVTACGIILWGAGATDVKLVVNVHPSLITVDIPSPALIGDRMHACRIPGDVIGNILSQGVENIHLSN